MLASAELIQEVGQRRRLAEMLPRWSRVPLYRPRLATMPAVDRMSAFHRLPMLTKAELREGFPGNFLGSDRALESLLAAEEVELEHTSGTSQERMGVLLGRGWWDAQEERALRLNRYVGRVLDEVPGARRAFLTPPACNGQTCPTVWSSVAHRTRGRTLAVNQARIPFVLPEAELGRMADEIGAWAPVFLDTDPVHGAWFALYCERQQIRFPSLRFILCSYEFVSAVHRRILERAFGVPVLNLYGSTETGHLLMEGDDGEMRACHENAFVEVANTDAQGVAELVVTTLTNDYMPLVRYRIGDLVERRVGPYATTYRVHGRIRDALATPEGARVTPGSVDDCMVGVEGIAHYEVRQASDGSCRFRFVPARPGLAAAGVRAIKDRLSRVLRLAAAPRVEEVAVLLPAPSGKFRLTVPA